MLHGADDDSEPQPEPGPARPAQCGDAGGLNYLLLCRVALGCSVRTNGKGRLPMSLDKGACATNQEGMEDAVFWSYQDPGPITWGNFREDDDNLECAESILRCSRLPSDCIEVSTKLGLGYRDPHDHPDYEQRNNADCSKWRELNNVAGVTNPPVSYHSLVWQHHTSRCTQLQRHECLTASTCGVAPCIGGGDVSSGRRSGR
jgi:hypothetical protein